MKLTAKFGFSVGLQILLYVLLAGSARANTIYTYTGNTYNNCTAFYGSSPPPACGLPYGIQLTFETILMGDELANLTNFGTGLIQPSVSSFSISDGGSVSIFSTDSGLTVNTFSIGTDGGGNITGWFFGFTRILGSLFAVTASTSGAADSSSANTPNFFGTGSITGNPGVWEKAVVGAAPIPEPEIYAMLGLGLGLMGWVGRRRKLQPA